MPDRLWDLSHQVSSHQHAALEKRLVVVARRLGNPVFVLIVERLHHESAAALAARTFDERGLAAGNETNPVLLVLSVRDRESAIETGKGNAGIIPEIDARLITKHLASNLSRHAPAEALGRAIDAVAESAEATADRRRPLPPEEGLESPIAAPGGSGVDADADATPDAAGEDAGDGGGNSQDPGVAKIASSPTGKGQPPRRSRLPFAAAAAFLMLLAIALRRRRSVISARENRPASAPPPGRPKP